MATTLTDRLGGSSASGLTLGGFSVSSTSSVTIGSGSKSFTADDGKFFSVGDFILISSDSGPSNYMAGQITSYEGGVLTVLISSIGGSGTYDDWTIRLSGAVGATGPQGAAGADGEDGSDGLSSSLVFSGYLYGCSLSYATSTTISISSGKASDSAGAVIITLASLSGCTLQSSGAWAAGNTANKLDTGAKATATCYHVHAIAKDDGTADALFSLSATAPTMPTGYTRFRRIGSIFTDGSGNIRPFIQHGDEFYFKDPVADVSTSVLSTTAVNYTVTAPTAIRTIVKFNGAAYHSATSAEVYVSCPDLTDAAPDISASPGANLRNLNTGQNSPNFISCMTNTSAQIRARSGISSTNLYLFNVGYTDNRGRL